MYTVNGERIAALLLTGLTYLCQFSDTSSHDNVPPPPPPFLPRVDRRLLGYPVCNFSPFEDVPQISPLSGHRRRLRLQTNKGTDALSVLVGGGYLFVHKGDRPGRCFSRPALSPSMAYLLIPLAWRATLDIWPPPPPPPPLRFLSCKSSETASTSFAPSPPPPQHSYFGSHSAARPIMQLARLPYIQTHTRYRSNKTLLHLLHPPGMGTTCGR